MTADQIQRLEQLQREADVANTFAQLVWCINRALDATEPNQLYAEMSDESVYDWTRKLVQGLRLIGQWDDSLEKAGYGADVLSYTAIVSNSGRVFLYAEQQKNNVKYADRIMEFADWSEFFGIVCGPSFARNPFELVRKLYVYKVN